jgi:squalene-hopene/tetraprenyl-beta-curcumene cyclase
MQLPFDQAQLATIIDCDHAFEQLSASWRAGVDWRPTDRRDTRRIYEMYPILFAPAFPAISEQALRSLVVACRLLSEALFAFDEVIDEPLAARERATGVAKGQSLQLDAICTFAELFPPTSEFWPLLHACFLAYVAAIQKEREITLADLDEATAVALARGKTAVARSCIAAMGIAGGRPDIAAVIADAVSEYYVARQMWDDLADWRKDLASGQHSLLLARAIAGLASDSARDAQSVGVAVYYEGHADYVLALGSTALDRAHAAIASLGVALPFGRLLDELANQFRDTRAALTELVERKRRMPGARPHALPAQPPGTSAEDANRLDVLWTAAQHLAVQAPRAFGEARHWMKISERTGLRSRLTQAGDVFQRALIVDALCDLPASLAESFAPVIAHEVSHVMRSRVCDSCGWGYLPELDELPADCDTLAQVLQLAVRCGVARRQDFERPLATAFGSSHGDGSFETWILPPVAERDAVHDRQAEMVERVWGPGPDPEVMSNLLYALALWDRDQFDVKIVAGCRYIVSCQRPDGSWPGRWYVGPYYSTYVAVRLLARVREGLPAVQRAIEALLARQHREGAWSRDESPSSLDTAHAILTLLAARRLEVADAAAIRASVARGLGALGRFRRSVR